MRNQRVPDACSFEGTSQRLDTKLSSFGPVVPLPLCDWPPGQRPWPINSRPVTDPLTRRPDV